MTGARIQHMNPLLSDVCHLCSSDCETLGHLFWECIEVRKFWGLVFQLLQVLVPGYHVPGPELVHIVNPFPLRPKTVFPILVSIHGTALWSIWKTYLGVLFEGEQFNPVALHRHFVSFFISHVQVLFSIACKKKKVASFIKLWCRSDCINICEGKVSVDISL